MLTIVCSVFGENHVPCTLKTESETKSSPGFSIDIISGILSEWMLPLLLQMSYFHSYIIWREQFAFLLFEKTYIVDLYSANPLKRLVCRHEACRHAACRHAATLEHIILTQPNTQTHSYCLLCGEAVFGLTQSPLGPMIYRTRYGHDISPFYHRCGSGISNFAPNRKLLFQWHCTYSHFLKEIR
jgi:hypothetical protein